MEKKSEKKELKSFGGRDVSNYGTSGSPLVFCIHGNKFGVARCCDDLIDEAPHDKSATSIKMDDDAAEDSPLLIRTKTKRSASSNGELHCHTDRNEGVDKRARRKLITASVLCVLFMIMEIVGGVMANSLAIATDAAHLMTDFASFMISLFSLWVASRPATKRMSFGWHRAEVIGATVSVLMIWVVTGVLVYIAVERTISMQFEIDATVMLITSGLGVLVNIIMGCSLHQHGHSHGGGGGSHGHSHDAMSDHGHSHGRVRRPSEASSHGSGDGNAHGHAHANTQRENINVTAAFIHVVGDFLQSLGVFVAAIVIYFKPTWIIIDPICTFVFSVLVLFTTIRILRDTMNVLMEGIPKDVSFTVVQETFMSVEGIVAVHNLRIWGLTTDKTALSAHLAVGPGTDAQAVLKEASMRIRAKYNFFEMTLQVEEFQDDMHDCGQCQAPSD